jgi:hypothetical protein
LFYRRFLKAQAIVEIERRKIHGLCVIFSEAPIFQNEKMREYAVKAIEDNYKVFFISRNNLDSHLKYFINTDHSILELISYKDFSLELMRFRYGDFMNKALFILDHKDVFANKIYDLKKKYKNVMILYTEDLQG